MVKELEAKKPDIVRFGIKPPADGVAWLEWTVEGADKISIDAGIGRVGPTGRLAIAPEKTTMYTLTAANQFGSVVKGVTYMVAQTEGPVDKSPGDLL